MKDQLSKLAAKRGLRVEERGSGHFQIIGGNCLVNYYPTSKKRSAYIAGETGKARHGVSPQEAVEMAFGPAPAGWVKPIDRSVRTLAGDEPKKRTVAEWVALLPSLRFAFRRRERG